MTRTVAGLLEFTLVATAALLSLNGESLFAHHGRGDTYVTDRTIDIHGVVRDVRWRNPHIAFLVDVTDDNGETTTWTVEHSNVSTLARLGYGRRTLQPGMEVTVKINPGTGGQPVGLCHGVTLEDGTVIFLRGVPDETPGRLNPALDID